MTDSYRSMIREAVNQRTERCDETRSRMADIRSWCAYNLADMVQIPSTYYGIMRYDDKISRGLLYSDLIDSGLLFLDRDVDDAKDDLSLLAVDELAESVFGGCREMSREEVACRIFDVYGQLPRFLSECKCGLLEFREDYAMGEAREFLSHRYLDGKLSRNDLVCLDIHDFFDDDWKPIRNYQLPRHSVVSHALDCVIFNVFTNHSDAFARDGSHFSVRDGSLFSADGCTMYIEKKDCCYIVRDAFYWYLVQHDSWSDLAGGQFEQALDKALSEWKS